MNIIRLLLFLSPFFVASAIFGQDNMDVTDKPRVDLQNHSVWGDANIIRVAIDEEYTYVFWEYITSRNGSGSWISMSSSTKLYSYQMSGNLNILTWGIISEDGSDVSELVLDERYDVKNDRRYLLVMVFPSLPYEVTIFDIKENVGADGFTWKGVHLNARRKKSSSSGHIYDSNKRNADGMSKSYFSSKSHQESGSPSSASSNNSYSPYSSNNSQDIEYTGSGTCFAVSSDGYLATCYHVIKDANHIRIRGINGDYNNTYDARVVNVDYERDLAIVKIIDSRFESIEPIPYTFSMSESDVGDAIYVLGYPLRAIMGDEIKLTDGIVSSMSGYQGDVSSYQLTNTVQPGNSGGPAFDRNGNIIGVVGSRLFVENATYAVKCYYLRNLIIEEGLLIPLGNDSLADLSIAEIVRKIKGFVYIIEVGI